MMYFNPLKWVSWAAQFFVVYVSSISYRQLLAATPVVLVTGVLIALAIGAGPRDAVAVRQQISEAIRRGDDATAELLVQRLIGQGERPEGLMMHQIGIAERLGQEERAERLAETLVQQSRSVDAAVWLLQNRYEGLPLDQLDSPAGRRMGELLRLVADQRPDDPRFWQPTANYLMATGQWEPALVLLRRLAEIEPSMGLRVSQLERQLGRTAEADATARSTLAALERRTPRSLDTVETIVAKAIAEVSLRQFKDAAARLNELYSRLNRQVAAMPPETKAPTADGPAAASGDGGSPSPTQRETLIRELSAVRLALADSLVLWAQGIENQTTVELPETPVARNQLMLRIMQNALAIAPDHPRVIALVSQQVLAAAERDDASLQALQRELVSGASPGVSHFVQGTAALIRGEDQAATHHLELARRQLPHSPVTLNNLAIALAEGRSGADKRLAEALALVDEALTQVQPPPLTFVETRGQILTRMGRHLDAIADLEQVVVDPTLAEEAHRSLAINYDAIGQGETARQHRDAVGAAGSASTDNP